MEIEAAISDIEACSDLRGMKILLQKIIENYGFASFNFLDIGNPQVDVPFYLGTTGEAWESDYKSNNFVHVDHCVRFARRSNVAFSWDEVKAPDRTVGPKGGAIKLLEAATDHGFRNGLVVPFHYRDRIGRQHSSLCVFYWKDTISRFKFLLTRKKIELQIIIIYWVQRSVDLVTETQRGGSTERSGHELAGLAEAPLSDRERDVIAWAARGKTVGETAEILAISEDTVTSHVKNSMRKLGASNKTHAAVRAVYLGLIDI